MYHLINGSRGWMRAVLALLPLIWSGAAFGYCNATNWNERSFNVTFPAALNVSAAPVGGVMARAEVRYADELSDAVCYGSVPTFSITVPNGELVPGYSGVYKTNLQGIGVRFVFIERYDVFKYIPPWTGSGMDGLVYRVPVRAVVELVRTEKSVAAGGTVSVAFTAIFDADKDSRGNVNRFQISSEGTTEVINDVYYGGCSTTTPAINVPMGKELIERIRYAEAPKHAFSLEVVCGTNKPGKPLPVKVYFEGDNERDGLLRLAGHGTEGVASNVGIMLESDKGAWLPFTPGRALAMDWSRSSAEGEVYRFSATATYIPITFSSRVKPGRADAMMNFIIQYD